MSELTASDTQAILGAIQAMRDDMQALTLEVRVNQAKNDEQFKTLRAEIKGEINELRAEVKAEIKALNDKVDELRDRQKIIDSRLWAFIVALVTFIGGGLVKVLWFDKA